ncbi:N-acetyltransferase family protein [Chitinimonas sp.]|uniref:GNAT family N-acetyltransferase n=1 Tax=Chitinimonas sp. TaxID=1934313 RepID=UPI0035AE85BF
MSEILIRAARPEDAEHIGRIRVAAWQAAYRGVMPDTYLDGLDPTANLDGLRLRLAAPDAAFRVLMGECDGVPQGFLISGTPRFVCDAGSVELYALNLAPAAWGRGLAQAMIAESLEQARRDGAQRMGLWCIASNQRALRCYDRAGFALGGQRRTSDDLTGLPITEVDCWHDLAEV